MTDHTSSSVTPLDVADRKMLAEIKANVLGTSREELLIGRFRVLERLGEGSMGIVFAAFDEQLQRRVALKLLHQGIGTSDDERRARLLREAQMLAQLEHPNIVQVYEAGEHEGQVYMVMALVEGKALDEIQRVEPSDGWKSLVHFYIAAGRGLAAAHASGVVHRDFKPHNVLVDTKGNVRVVDFGLARESLGEDQQLTGEIAISPAGAIERPRGDHITETGTISGTPAYMAPELFDGRPASAASDQFSFCVALYEAMYGRRPFGGDRVQDVVAAAKQGQILPPPVDRSVPQWLFDALARGLSASPEARHPSMEVLLAELEHDRTRRWKQAGVMLAVAAVVGGTWWVRGHTGHAAALVRHEEACREQAESLAVLWEGAKQGLVRPPAELDDVDGLVSMLDADATPFFIRWEGACAANMDGVGESCRAGVKRAFEATVGRGSSELLNVDVFHQLAYDLERCVEEGESVSCRGPSIDSPAVAALGDARAAELVGDLDGARDHIESAVELAAEANDEITRLRAMLQRGALLEKSGSTESAGAILADVAFDALVCDADVLAFDASLERAEAEVLHFGRVEPAARFLAIGSQLLDKPGMPELPLRRARLLEKRGDAELYLEHDCVSALPHLQQALELREQVIATLRADGQPTDHIERLAANAELNIANAGYYALTEKSDRCPREGATKAQVIERYHAARARLSVAVHHPQHIELADFDYGMGAALMAIGDFDAAVVAFESALSIYLARQAPDAPVVGDAYWALAAAHAEAGDLVQATDHVEQSMAIRMLRRNEDGQELALAEAYDLLGLIQHAQGDSADARETIGRALATLGAPRASLGLNGLEQLYRSATNLAMVELERGEPAALSQVLIQIHESERALVEYTHEPHEAFAQQRLAEAMALLDGGEVDEALLRLAGIERRPNYDASLDDIVDRIRKRAAAAK